jgi:Beta-1,3-glucanase
MANYLQILINNNTGLPQGQDLYLYIIGEVYDATNNDYDYYSYQLSTDGNFVATVGAANTVYPISFSSLGVTADNTAVSYFNFNQGENFSGRIWFSTSNNLMTISKLQASQPNPSGGDLFDFVELTINANDNVNCDTTQVVGLGIPITMINPAVLSFPPTGAASQYTYPNAVGIVPGNTLSSICTNFTSYVNAVELSEFADCVASYAPAVAGNANVQWLINPGYQVPLYDASQTPSGLAVCLDKMIFQFFNYFNSGNTLSIIFEGTTYTGSVVIEAGLDISNPTQEYCALIFTDISGNTYPIFYPYFNTNSAATQGGSLNPNGVLPPPPGFWTTQNLPVSLPASGQVLQCEGVFNDGNPTSGNKTILAALQNIVVTFLNRGLIPGADMNNFFACTGNLTLTSNPVTFTDNSPADSTTVPAASLLYVPSQIPANTNPATCSVSGSIELSGATPVVTQAFSLQAGQVVVSQPDTLPGNYCQSPVAVQLTPGPNPAPDQLVQFAFNYVSASWPGGTAPSLVAPVTVTYTPNLATAPTASFAGAGFSTDIQVGMNVFDINVQNPSVVSAVGTDEFTIKSTVTGVLPSPNTDTLVVGNFYPMAGTVAKGCWNAFAAFLHYGGNGTPAPYISNQGYAFAYDDDGGYSSDITVSFPENGSCALGIYLGPLA